MWESMYDKSLERLSILCRLLKYDNAQFQALVRLPLEQIRESIAEREGLEHQRKEELFLRARKLHEELAFFNILHPLHPFYPERFHGISDSPAFLCTSGDLAYLKEPMLTVIGSRRTLLSFTDWMNDQYVQFLQKSQVVTVSGGAFGIDALATKLALFCNRPSVVILPSGLERCYPQHVRRWRQNPRALLMTEYFPFESVRNYHFVHRNRLLGAIAEKLLVVQCAQRSGTMTTVNYALDCGGEIMTLPSFPGAIESSGNIHLLKQGAQLISTADDLDLCMRMFSPHPNSEEQKQNVWNPQCNVGRQEHLFTHIAHGNIQEPVCDNTNDAHNKSGRGAAAAIDTTA